MKILYWTPRFWPDVGGVLTLAMRTLPQLMKRGIDFVVVTSHGTTRQPDFAEYEGIPIQRFPFWSALTQNDVPLILKIRKDINALKIAFDPDLIHINFSGYTAFFQVVTAGNNPISTLIALQSNITELKSGSGTTLGKLFHLADWVTAISKSTLEIACKTIPEIAGRSSVIYGCADENSMVPTPYSSNPPGVLGIGRLSHEKGFDLLIDGFSLIATRFPNLSLTIIGDGPERISLEPQVINMNLKDRVKFLGSIPNEDLPKYINNASLVVIPSRCKETFGLVAVESAWMARPVVAANTGGLAEIVVDGETGFLVDMENSLTIANAIVTLLSQPEKAASMGLAGRLRVQKEFSLAKFVDAYDLLYKHLANKKNTKTLGKSIENET